MRYITHIYIYISSRRDGEQEWVFEGSAYSMLPCEWLNRVCTVFTPRFVRYEARDSILPSMMNRPTLYTETRQRYQRFGIYCLRSYMYYSHYIYNMLTNQHRLEKKNPGDNENYSEHFYHQHSNLDIVLLEELSLSHSGQWPNRITCSNNRQWFTDNRHYISHVTIRHHVATA